MAGGAGGRGAGGREGAIPGRHRGGRPDPAVRLGGKIRFPQAPGVLRCSASPVPASPYDPVLRRRLPGWTFASKPPRSRARRIAPPSSSRSWARTSRRSSRRRDAGSSGPSRRCERARRSPARPDSASCSTSGPGRGSRPWWSSASARRRPRTPCARPRPRARGPRGTPARRRSASRCPRAGTSAVTTEAVVEGIRLGLYVFEAYKTEKAKKSIRVRDAPRAPGRGRRGAQGPRGGHDPRRRRPHGARPRQRARQHGDARPTSPSARRRIAAEHGLGVHVMERAEMAALGMGSLLGVAQGSAQPPKLIVLTYEPAGRRGPRRHGRRRRQGPHVRLGRHLAQAGRQDGGHEVRHVRRRRRARRHAGRGAAEARRPRRRPRARVGEHARRRRRTSRATSSRR